MEILVVIGFLGVLLAILLAFKALDNWHKRRAWRNANRFAEDYMREVHGVERGVNGGWHRK